MHRKIIGIFGMRAEAASAIDDLKRIGYRPDDISVVIHNAEEARKFEDETATMVQEGATGGAATGGVIGGIGGLLAGLGALTIPGIGPLLAAGPLAAALAGTAVGAAGGGLIGGLIGLGIPEHEAKEYDAMVGKGRILVAVDAEESNRMDVYRIFQNNNSLNRRYDEELANPRATAAQTSSYRDMPAMGASNLDANRMDNDLSDMNTGLASPADLENDRSRKLHRK
ncbi:hypothetical protein CDO73_12625 [Saccharibacillus sp. O23]|uniref:general stress protein n=1 Tax=Saccharibacillus sp. O23 TaxID=2009338 RepID=UPI000B4E6C39|nr:general stress protein [Saccharibacillus sp. O23]OWR29919.1 hypothetical protein CDO73_12625 [Saccharibacillus sp. O23]